MASTISTINQSKVDARVVEALRNVLPLLNAFSFRAQADGAIKNDSIYVPIATDPTAQSKTLGTLVTSNGTVAGTQVQLSNSYAAGWDCAEGAMSPELFPSYWADKAAGAVYSLAKQVVDAGLALVTASNYDNIEGTDKLTVAAADFGQADLASVWGIAENKIKQRQRSLILNATYASAIMSDAALVFATASGTNMLSSGILPQLIGMNTYAYAGLPANSENLTGVVLGKAAILAAVAPIAPLASAGDGQIMERRIITEPESGISCLYTSTVGAGGLVQGECAILYGVAKGQNAAVRIVSA